MDLRISLQNLAVLTPKQCRWQTHPAASEAGVSCCVLDKHSTGNVSSCCQCTLKVHPEMFRLWLLRFCRGFFCWGPCVPSECDVSREAELLKVSGHSSLLFSNLQRCGVVAESHTIDERSEWRTFGDSVRPQTLLPFQSPSARPLAQL